MTILICGASGLVGREMSILLKEKEIPFIGTYHSNKLEGPNMFHINFLNEKEVGGFLKEKSVTVCIFCIVERLVDVCENDWPRIKDTNILMENVVIETRDIVKGNKVSSEERKEQNRVNKEKQRQQLKAKYGDEEYKRNHAKQIAENRKKKNG